MNRVDRLQAILIQLQSRSCVRGQDLADRFEVSLRTIYRDMLALAEAGVPIRAEAGVGYALERGYLLPPVALTREEAGALFMAGKLIGADMDSGFGARYSQAIDKIRAVLGIEQKAFVENLDKRVVGMDRGSGPPSSVLEALQAATAEGRVASILYRAEGRDCPERREVEPLGLLFSGASRRMVAYCRLRKGFRAFALERVIECEVLGERFDPSAYADPASLAAELFPGSEFAKVVLRFDEGSPYERFKNPGLFGFCEERAVEGGVELELRLDSALYVAPWLLEFGNRVAVLEPPELREELRRRAQELFEHYSKDC